MHVKIIASLGPASSSPEVVERLALLGVSGFRINFAHGSPEEWSRYVENVRRAEERVGHPIALMGDLVGPSTRLGALEEPLELRPGEKAVIFLGDKAAKGGEKRIPLPVRRFFEAVEEGDVLVMDDGRVRLRVVEVKGDEVVVEALTPARITSHKAIVVRGKDLGLPTLTERDIKAIEFAVKHGFDYISLSYTREAEDLRVLRTIIREKGGDQAVAAKVETRSAVENLPYVVREADLVVVARGDLGMNYGIEEVPMLQQRIVYEARRQGKPVVVATQVLESMVNNPSPTRAEATDVYVAVSQGADAIMLTGETAIGRYPVEAVKWLRRILRCAETTAEVKRHLGKERRWSYALSVVEAAEAVSAKMIIAYSMGGTLPPKLAAPRPKPLVVIGTPDKGLARRLALLWGMRPMVVPASSYEEGLRLLEQLLYKRGELAIGDTVVEAYRVGTENRVIIKQVMGLSEEGEVTSIPGVRRSES